MCKKTTSNSISFVFIISQLIFYGCGYSLNDLNSQTEKLRNRFILNYNLFVELKDSSQLYLANSKNKNTFLLTDIIKDSAIRVRYSKLNIEQFIAYPSSNKIWFEIYFEDTIDPNMYLSFQPNFDTTGGVGRHPIRAIIQQDSFSRDAWIVRQYFD